ncbi:hypothetical protein J0A71_08g16840 [Encephalitozoon cuniculi]|uniref:Uncharacterized protein n=1 Tax=Encephalitozoon cuniculi TaxID=6035 RepID=M1K3G8_ENCCN|nr:hypothetical protein ECU05_0110 [Encephalitozoon cuniculi]UYI27797.1 hypothetical protein J0A71_08g16840 [Encephalitozoon cuniculi]
MRPFLMILSVTYIASAESPAKTHVRHHNRYHSHSPPKSNLRKTYNSPRLDKSLSDIGITDARRVPPVYISGNSSPLVADVGPDSGESGVVLAPSIDGSSEGNIGIYVSPSRDGQGIGSRERLISLHHLIHHARGEALKANAISSAAKLEASALLAQRQELNAKIMANRAAMLQEEEQRLVAQRSSNPLILVKDTVPVANVANNNLSFEHHNELLNKKLDMIKKDQDEAIKRAENLARLHKARTQILPDSLVASDPKQFKDFVDGGPAQDLTFEVPVDPSIGNYYVSSDPGENLQTNKAPLTTGDLPYFIAHSNENGVFSPYGSLSNGESVAQA